MTTDTAKIDLNTRMGARKWFYQSPFERVKKFLGELSNDEVSR
jgi:hypothetical protein